MPAKDAVKDIKYVRRPKEKSSIRSGAIHTTSLNALNAIQASAKGRYSASGIGRKSPSIRPGGTDVVVAVSLLNR